MKFIRYTSVLSLMLVCGMDSVFGDAPQAPRPVYMTSQIQRLLNEKQEKVSKLEECDGKRKGFMIAGISTIGLTAVGVGVNIAQASKSNKLSNQIADQTLELEKQQNNLANINAQISEKQSDKARQECEAQEGKIYVNGQCLDRERYNCDQNPDKEWKDGKCVDKEKPQQPQQPQYDGKIGDSCGEGKVWFVTFNNPTKKCLGMSGIVSCDCIPGERYDGIIGNPCTSNGDGSVWTEGGDKKCLVAEGSKESVACSCKKPSDAVAQQTQTGLGAAGGSGNDVPEITLRSSGPQQNQNPPEPDLTILENPSQDYGVTKKEFCVHVWNSTKAYLGMSINFENLTGNPDAVNAQIRNVAGHGYHCKQFGGKWTVTKESYGRYCKCELDKSVCLFVE